VSTEGGGRLNTTTDDGNRGTHCWIGRKWATTNSAMQNRESGKTNFILDTDSIECGKRK